MVSKGDVVLVYFPFSNDPRQTKPRPAVILWVSQTGDDVTFCAITSQNMDQLFPEDIPILPEDPEFVRTGLRVPSKIRTTRIATLTKKDVIKRFGKLGKNQIKILNAKMIEMFQL
jgi:mRNA interferase MazF